MNAHIDTNQLTRYTVHRKTSRYITTAQVNSSFHHHDSYIEHRPAGTFTCVRWQVTLCDPIWQVARRWVSMKSRAIHNSNYSSLKGLEQFSAVQCCSHNAGRGTLNMLTLYSNTDTNIKPHLHSGILGRHWWQTGQCYSNRSVKLKATQNHAYHIHAHCGAHFYTKSASHCNYITCLQLSVILSKFVTDFYHL